LSQGAVASTAIKGYGTISLDFIEPDWQINEACGSFQSPRKT